jgi:hypothetical protein
MSKTSPYFIGIDPELIEKRSKILGKNVTPLSSEIAAVDAPATIRTALWKRALRRYRRIAVVTNKLVAEAKLFHKTLTP